MKMKSVSIPEDLHAWLYENTNPDRKSLYAVVEWLRDCKEHCDRAVDDSEFISVTNSTYALLVRFIEDKPKFNEYVEIVSNTGKVRTTNDLSKAIGFRIYNQEACEPDQITISCNMIKGEQ